MRGAATARGAAGRDRPPDRTPGRRAAEGRVRRRGAPPRLILELAEIDKDARVHDARHIAATLLLEQGVDIRVVQAVLGHSQLTTTKRYTHIMETLASEAAARMGRALWDS
ncbi:tyrosine-type recombinase/integrase [Streptosporangium sandarakinum]